METNATGTPADPTVLSAVPAVPAVPQETKAEPAVSVPPPQLPPQLPPRVSAATEEPSLPPNWEALPANDGTGDSYYWNNATNETSWDRPR